MNKKLDDLLSEIDELKQKLDTSRPLLNETILQAINFSVLTFDLCAFASLCEI